MRHVTLTTLSVAVTLLFSGCGTRYDAGVELVIREPEFDTALYTPRSSDSLLRELTSDTFWKNHVAPHLQTPSRPYGELRGAFTVRLENVLLVGSERIFRFSVSFDHGNQSEFDAFAKAYRSFVAERAGQEHRQSQQALIELLRSDLEPAIREKVKTRLERELRSRPSQEVRSIKSA